MTEFTDKQLRILCALVEGKYQTHKDLHEGLSIKPNTLSDALHKLESSEFIHREKSTKEPQKHRGRGRPKEPIILTADPIKLGAICSELDHRIHEIRHDFYKNCAEKWHKYVVDGEGNNDFCKKASRKFNLLTDFESAYHDLKKKSDKIFIEVFLEKARRIE